MWQHLSRGPGAGCDLGPGKILRVGCVEGKGHIAVLQGHALEGRGEQRLEMTVTACVEGAGPTIVFWMTL